MSKKFKFKLEPILKLRQHQSESAKQELGKAVSKRAAKDQEIEDVLAYKRQLLTERYNSSSAHMLQAKIHHMSAVEEQIKKLHNQRQDLIEIENFRRKKLGEAMQKEKIFDKLKERQKEKYNYEQNIEEAKELDEISRQDRNILE